MEVLKRQAVIIADNTDHPPGVHRLPMKTYEAIMTPEGHAEMIALLTDDPRRTQVLMPIRD